MNSNRAVSFSIWLSFYPDAANVQSLSMDNEKTNEKLVIKGADESYGDVFISRYPVGVSDKWIDEMSKILDYKYRIIKICI